MARLQGRRNPLPRLLALAAVLAVVGLLALYLLVLKPNGLLDLGF